jgi:hypothetical protein
MGHRTRAVGLPRHAVPTCQLEVAGKRREATCLWAAAAGQLLWEAMATVSRDVLYLV